MSNSDPQNIHTGHRSRLKRQYIDAVTLDCFHEHQVLEMLLFYAIPRRDVNPLAHQLIDHFGSLHGVLNAGFHELVDFGLSENTALLIKLSGEISAYSRVKRSEGTKITSIDDAITCAYSLIGRFGHETICTMSFDNDQRLIHHELIARGTSESVDFSMRRIISTALLPGVCSMIIAHNHPSGDCRPSTSDIRSTKVLKDTLSEIGVRLIDHIIVAEPYCYAILRDYTKLITDFSPTMVDSDGMDGEGMQAPKALRGK